MKWLSKRKELRERQSTRQMMGITKLTEHGVKTPHGELVYFLVRPYNLSVLSEAEISARERSLMEFILTIDNLRILTFDSRESYQNNKNYYRQRLEEETNPKIRELLAADMQELDEIQTMTSSAREFAIVIPVNKQNGESAEAVTAQASESLRRSGFDIRLATKQDICRILAVYYQHDMTTEVFDQYDGEGFGFKPSQEKQKKAKKPASNGGRGQKRAKAPAKMPVNKDFIDMIAPAAIRFNTDHYICGNAYRTVFALQGFPPKTDTLALLRHLGGRNGVAISIYVRKVEPTDETRLLNNSNRKNRMDQAANDVRQAANAQANIQDVFDLATIMERNGDRLEYCAAYVELSAWDLEGLKKLESAVLAELIRAKINVERLMLRQRDGFQAVNPAGWNSLGNKCERVLPASSVANLFPFNYSGKTDAHGFFIGRDRNGTCVILDPDRRAEDKTNGSALILGNSGQGKSYLLKLLLVNQLEAGKTVICLDPEHELEDLCNALSGCFVDLMSGKYIINPLEPKLWEVDGGKETDADTPKAFRQQTRLSQHISFLKDFFRSYKDFSDQHIDTIELMLERTYQEWNLSDRTDFSTLKPEDYPILSDLYAVMEKAYRNYESEVHPLYTKDMLQEVLLGLHSMCVGSESKFFNGHTNVTSHRFLVFGVKALVRGNTKVKDALLFNVLAYLSDKLLTEGNAVATLDELYIWLSSPTTVEYIRNMLKRVRKKESSLIMASQNIEDFNIPGVREMTRPLFAIPTHQFIFHCGTVDKEFYMSNLQLVPSEYNHIKDPHRGICLFKCGKDRFLLDVKAPTHKSVLFGTGGGQ